MNGTDHDGDTGSADITYSDNAIEELKAYFANAENWFNTKGELDQAFNNDTIEWVCNSITGYSIDDGVVSKRPAR